MLGKCKIQLFSYFLQLSAVSSLLSKAPFFRREIIRLYIFWLYKATIPSCHVLPVSRGTLVMLCIVVLSFLKISSRKSDRRKKYIFLSTNGNCVCRLEQTGVVHWCLHMPTPNELYCFKRIVLFALRKNCFPGKRVHSTVSQAVCAFPQYSGLVTGSSSFLWVQALASLFLSQFFFGIF